MTARGRASPGTIERTAMADLPTCTRCVIHAGVPGVVFDDAGVCNYCHLHDRLAAEWPTGDEGQRILHAEVERIRHEGKGKPYDCVVGVSGGTDSTYLMVLARQLGLRPLAVHMDNGWNTEVATRNIMRATEALDIDLQTYVLEWEEFRDVLIAFLRASFPWADAPSDMAIDATLFRVANREGIGAILNGSSFRTEGKMPAEWTYLDGRMTKHIHKKYGTMKMRTYPNLTVWQFGYYSVLKRIRIFRPLNYIDYHKDQARDVLQREVGWRYYGGHHHESLYTRFVYCYLLPKKFGIDKRIITHSALVRSGEMTREEALEDLRQPPMAPEKIEEDKQYVLQKLGLSDAEFAEIMAQPPRSFREFPSYYPIFETFGWLMKHVLRWVLPWTPPFLHELETRKKQKDG